MNSALMPLKKAEPKPTANQRSIQAPGAGTCPPLEKMSRISRRVIFTAIPLSAARIISTVESSPPRNIHGPFPAAFFFLSPAARKRRQILFKYAPARPSFPNRCTLVSSSRPFLPYLQNIPSSKRPLPCL